MMRRSCYRIFLPIVSLLLVRGFILPSPICNHERYMERNLLSDQTNGVFPGNRLTCRRAAKDMNPGDNTGTTYLNPSVKTPGLKPSPVTTNEQTIQVKKRKKTWNEYYPLLKEFYSTNGHSNVTKSDDKDLFEFTASLRKNYRRQANGDKRQKFRNSARSNIQQLSNEKMQALQDVQFVWYLPNTKKTWEVYFPLLKAFHSEHGHCNVTKDDDEDLFKYICSLRKNYIPLSAKSQSASIRSQSKRQLPEDKLRALKALDFSWVAYTPPRAIRPGARTWEEYFPRLKLFYIENGHSNVTKDDDKDLFQYVSSLRKNYRHQHLGSSLKSGRQKRLPDDKYQALQDINFAWQYKSRSPGTNKLRRRKLTKLQRRPHRTWSKYYPKLERFQKTHGHCDSNLISTEDKDLFLWIKSLERRYGLPEDKRQDLQRLGISLPKPRAKRRWKPPTRIIRKSHEERWNEKINELKLYRRKYGHCEVPQEYEENLQLARWVMNQRTFYRMNHEGMDTSLCENRIDQLEELDFVWDCRDKGWWAKFERLKDYQKMHGHLIIETSDFVNDDLRQWLNEQRQFYKSTTKRYRLNPKRIEALESLPGFRWSGRRAKIPTKDDWSQLLGAIRERGISPETKAKEHWFDGLNPFEDEVKTEYSEDELMALWYEENDADEDDDGDNYIDDEDSRLFLRA